IRIWTFPGGVIFFRRRGKFTRFFGGKDEVSDATGISPEGLATTMKRGVDHDYDPRREKWDIDGSAPDLKGEASSITALPGYHACASHNGVELKKQECIHCHQVSEILRQP